MKTSKVLLGNTFPVGLIRRSALCTPITVEKAKQILSSKGFESFWGHADTLNAVSAALKINATPKTVRPALILSDTSLPVLNGQAFNTVIVFSPSYVQGFRPTYGVEVDPANITGWTPLLITF